MQVRVNIWGNKKKLIQEYAERTGKKIRDASTASARRIAVNLAFNTEPYGFSEDSKRKGEEAIRGDIRKVFAIASDVFAELIAINPRQANAFYKCMQAGEYERASGILRSMGSSFAEIPLGNVQPELHQGARGFGGRVTVDHQLELIKKTHELADYIATIEPRTGYAAAGWADCAYKLGGARGIPSWKKGKHGLPYEIGKVVNNADKPLGRIIMTNLVPYASEACPPRNQARALAREKEVLMDLIRRAIESEDE